MSLCILHSNYLCHEFLTRLKVILDLLFWGFNEGQDPLLVWFLCLKFYIFWLMTIYKIYNLLLQSLVSISHYNLLLLKQQHTWKVPGGNPRVQVGDHHTLSRTLLEMYMSGNGILLILYKPHLTLNPYSVIKLLIFCTDE